MASVLNYQRVTDPAQYAVTLAEAKLHLRVDHGDEDAHIFSLIGVAQQVAEKQSRRTFTQATYDLFLNGWPKNDLITFPAPPLVSVAGVYYTPEIGDEQELAAENYVVSATAEPGRLWLAPSGQWPGETLRRQDGVRVRFTAGYGTTPESVPRIYRQAMLLLIGHFYENRETIAIIQGANMVVLPLAARHLLEIDRGGWL